MGSTWSADTGAPGIHHEEAISLDSLCSRLSQLFEVDAVAVSIGDAHTLRVVAANNHRARRLAVLQWALGQGPGPLAVKTRAPVVVGDIDTAALQWPDLVAAVRLAGLTAMAAYPLSAGDTVVGSIDLFCRRRCNASDVDLETISVIAEAVAAYVASSLEQQRFEDQVSQLEYALASRVSIEQAKGMLAGKLDIAIDDAFELLRGYARHHNRKVEDIADEVVDHHCNPETLQAHARRTARRPTQDRQPPGP